MIASERITLDPALSHAARLTHVKSMGRLDGIKLCG